MQLYLLFIDPKSFKANVLNVTITSTIVIMQLALVIRTDLAYWLPGSTDAATAQQADSAIFSLMVVCNACFSLEIVLSIVAVFAPVSLVRSRRLLAEQIAWICVDFLAVVAFWIQCGISDRTARNSLELISVLRIGRVAHSVARNPEGALLIKTLVASIKALVFAIIWVAVAAFFLGGLIYYVEDLLVPETTMIVDYVTAIWFMLVTFTTVGYGDIYPKSGIGRAITIFAIFFAVIFMAMPITIVGNNFQQAWEEREKLRVVEQIQKSMLDHGMGVEEIIGLFSMQDTSGDGSLSYVEFKSMLIGLGIQMKLQDARRIYSLFDTDGDGSCSYQEFVRVVFPTFDVDALSKVEVQRLMNKVAEAPVVNNTGLMDEMNRSPDNKNVLEASVPQAEPAESTPAPAASESPSNVTVTTTANGEGLERVLAEVRRLALNNSRQNERLLTTLASIDNRLKAVEKLVGPAGPRANRNSQRV